MVHRHVVTCKICGRAADGLLTSGFTHRRYGICESCAEKEAEPYKALMTVSINSYKDFDELFYMQEVKTKNIIGSHLEKLEISQNEFFMELIKLGTSIEEQNLWQKHRKPSYN